MKKLTVTFKGILIVVGIAVVLFIVAFFVANVYYNQVRKDPVGESESSFWLCTEPYIEIHYNDRGVSQTSFVKANGETVKVEVYFDTPSGTFTFCAVSHDDGIYIPDDVLMEGAFVYGEDDIRLRVTNDRIFDGEYEGQIIVFERAG